MFDWQTFEKNQRAQVAVTQAQIEFRETELSDLKQELYRDQFALTIIEEARVAHRKYGPRPRYTCRPKNSAVRPWASYAVPREFLIPGKETYFPTMEIEKLKTGPCPTCPEEHLLFFTEEIVRRIGSTDFSELRVYILCTTNGRVYDVTKKVVSLDVNGHTTNES